MNVNSDFVYYSNAVASDDERVTQSAFMRIMLSVVPLRIVISVKRLAVYRCTEMVFYCSSLEVCGCQV
jgi:hypothetical protein